MTITQPILASIAKRFRDPSLPKLNQSQMAEHLGLSKTWASKLMGGKIRSISDDQACKLEDFLGIKLFPYFQEKGEPISDMVKQLSLRMADNELLSRIVSALMEMQDKQDRRPFGPKWIETKDMTRIGQEIIKIAFANEDKPGKVARLVLELLA